MPLSRDQRDALTEALTLAFALFADHTATGLVSGSLADELADRVAARLGARKLGQTAADHASPTPFLTQSEAVTYTGRSLSTVRRARTDGLPFARVGGNVFFQRDVLDAWLRGDLVLQRTEPVEKDQKDENARAVPARGPPHRQATTRKPHFPVSKTYHGEAKTSAQI